MPLSYPSTRADRLFRTFAFPTPSFLCTFATYQTALPFGFSPSAFQCLAHPDGELATSRAAAKAGIPMTLSTYSTTAVEDVVAQGKGNPYAMQLSIMKSREANLSIIRRAEGALSSASLLCCTG